MEIYTLSILGKRLVHFCFGITKIKKENLTNAVGRVYSTR